LTTPFVKEMLKRHLLNSFRQIIFFVSRNMKVETNLIQVRILKSQPQHTHTQPHTHKAKAELRQSFSTCVYCMRLRFQSNYLGWFIISLKTQQNAENARWKRLSQLSFIATYVFLALRYFFLKIMLFSQCKYIQTRANSHIRKATTCMQRPSFWSAILSFYSINGLWTMTTYQQRPLFLGPKGGDSCTKVWMH